MADNSSIAFQIYKTIEEKQNELIKKNAIKPEDIQDLSEESFIRELQTSVNFYTKNISNNFIVSEIYEEILKQVDRISDISQITTSSGIKIPDEIIREGVKLATEKTKLEDTDNYFENNNNDNNNNELISQFNEIESLEEKINFYENLSDDEKKDIQRDVYSKLFGLDMAQTIIKQKNLQPLEENNIFNGLSETEQDEVRKIRESNDPLKYICESLGIDYSEGQNKFDRFGMVISRLRETLEKKNEIDEGTFDTVSEVLVKVLKFSKEDAEKFIKNFEKKYKSDPDFLKKNLEYKEHRKKTAEKYESVKEPLKYFVKKNGLGKFAEIEDYIRDSFSEDGLSLNTFRVNLSSYYDQKGLPMLSILKDASIFNEEYLKAKEEFEELYPKGDSFLENSRILDVELLGNFNMNEMANMVEDIYGSEFKNSMLFLKSDFERSSIDKSLDDLYDVKGESIFLKEPTEEWRKKKTPPSIEAEDIIISSQSEEIIFDSSHRKIDIGIPQINELSFGDGQIETNTKTSKVLEIKRLIEKYGHKDEITGSITKLFEAARDGDGKEDEEKKDETKKSTPSNEEKE